MKISDYEKAMLANLLESTIDNVQHDIETANLTKESLAALADYHLKISHLYHRIEKDLLGE